MSSSTTQKINETSIKHSMMCIG